MAATQPQFPTINVVPAGFRWNDDAAKTALERGTFLRVGGQSVGRRTLSGARRAWASDDPEENRTIFLIFHRITGTPENVRAALQYAGFSAADIDEAIAGAVTRENYQTTMAQAVQDELARHANTRRTKPQVEGYDWEQIVWFGQNIKSAQIGTKTGEARGAVATGGRAGAGDTLAEKLRKLGQGKVLDVSNMDLATGKGVRSIPAPKTAKSGKFGYDIGRVPIISNNLDKYVRALELAYGGDVRTIYAQHIGQVRAALGGAPAGAGGVRAPSPPRATGAVIAPPPQFIAVGGAPRVATPRGGGVGTIGGAGLVAVPPVGALGALGARQ